MLLKRNILETLALFFCSGTFICVVLNYFINISPFGGIWLLLYIFLLFSISITFSFKIIKGLLGRTRPVKYDFDNLVKEYPYTRLLVECLPKLNQSVKKTKSLETYKDYDTNELSVISTVLERKLVSSWYKNYISQEISFPFACKQLLDQMIGKAFQICNKIDTKEVYIDICSVFIIHLKEYEKAVKRHQKLPETSIEAFYTKSYHDSAKKNTAPGDYYTDVLRLIMKELIPWELWDTPHSELLIRILARRLDNFIDTTIANPVWLNHKVITLLTSKNTKEESHPKEESHIKSEDKTDAKDIENIQNIEDQKLPDSTEEKSLSSVLTDTAVPALSRELGCDIASEKTKDVNINTEAVDITSSPVLRQRRGRQGRNEVKIYDRIIEGSVKTWDTDMDLQCISLGQDLLESLDGELTLSRLWAADEDGSPNPPRRASPQLWFGEDAIDLDMSTTSPETSPKVLKETPNTNGQDITTHKETFKTPKITEVNRNHRDLTVDTKASQKLTDPNSSPKFKDTPRFSAPNSPRIKEEIKNDSPISQELLKEFQTTVHQAKTKIVDLQDEAAGMMEGLFDFGMAGIRKGLRFTGLSDDSVEKEKSPSAQKYNLPSEPIKIYNDVHGNAAVVQREENGSAVPTLCKQQRVSSQDSVGLSRTPLLPSPLPPAVPDGVSPVPAGVSPISTGVSPVPAGAPPTPPSPEPQYEEAADLSTSIAKLRHLLIQRTAACAENESDFHDEYDVSNERSSSPGSTSNNMQRLDRLFQRTVTGVFNSLRGAVGGEGGGAVGGEGEGEGGHTHWEYVTTNPDNTISDAIARLVCSRRAHTHVDAALDSLEHLQLPTTTEQGDDDDYEECVYGTCTVCAVEAARAAALLRSHVANRLAVLLMHDITEPLITTWLDEFTSWIKSQIFSTFEQLSKEDTKVSEVDEPMAEFDIQKTCGVILEALPAPLHLFGLETLSTSIHFVTSSFSHQNITRVLIARSISVLALHYKKAAALRNPNFDN